MIRLIRLLTGFGVAAMLVASIAAAPAQAASGSTGGGSAGVSYVRENSISYPLKHGGGLATNCTGFAWIGQTETNWIEAYSTVNCAGRWFSMGTETWIRKSPNTPTHLAHNKARGDDVSSVYAATSVYGSYYGQYCVHGYGDAYNGFVSYSGFGIVCIVT